MSAQTPTPTGTDTPVLQCPVPRQEVEELTVELDSCEEVGRANASATAPDDELIIDLGDVSEPSVQRTGGADSSVSELREQCRQHSLRVRGTKEELVHRLAEALG